MGVTYSGGRFISFVYMRSGGNGVVDDIGNDNVIVGFSKVK